MIIRQVGNRLHNGFQLLLNLLGGIQGLPRRGALVQTHSLHVFADHSGLKESLKEEYWMRETEFTGATLGTRRVRVLPFHLLVRREFRSG